MPRTLKGKPGTKDKTKKLSSSVSIIGAISSVITIFGFLTGINALPSLFKVDVSNGIFNSTINQSSSFGIFLISQGAYFISLYVICKYLKNKILPKDDEALYYDLPTRHPKAKFMLVMIVLMGLGISYLFMESYWGPLKFGDMDSPLAPFYFLMCSVGGNYYTVKTAMSIDLEIF